MAEVKPGTFRTIGLLAISLTLIFYGFDNSKAWKAKWNYGIQGLQGKGPFPDNQSSITRCQLIYIGGLGLAIIGLLCLYHKDNFYGLLFCIMSTFFFTLFNVQFKYDSTNSTFINTKFGRETMSVDTSSSNSKFEQIRYFYLCTYLFWSLITLIFIISQVKKGSFIILGMLGFLFLFQLFLSIAYGLEIKDREGFMIFVGVLSILSGFCGFYYAIALVANEGLGKDTLPTMDREN